MANVDVRQYVIQSSGNWTASKDGNTSDLLILDSAGDSVALTGPLTINVTLQAVNRTSMLIASFSATTLHYHDVYSYNLAIPAGQAWQYGRADESFANRVPGVNEGFRILIRHGYAQPAAAVSVDATDVPCGFAVGTIRNVSEFFPSPCEPCAPGMPISLPPGGSPTLSPPSHGGCVRPRYFNGMFISREDLETEQRYFRLKNKMQNRAMGAGVVWGLSISRTTRGICVQPGYGVDCCGNDIIITEGYQVPSDVLLADPAAHQFLLTANLSKRFSSEDCGERPTPPGGGGDPDRTPCRRMHLLLEYVECPEQPRPVHGDPCNPTATSCEMSRIRETARLRLVPPRDYDPTGPIDRFLAVVKDIAEQNGIDINPAPGGGGGTGVATAVPFQVRIQASATGQPQFPPAGVNTTLTLSTSGVSATANLPSIIPATVPFGFSLHTPTISGYQLFAGQLRDNQTNTIRATVSPSGQSVIDWNQTGVQIVWTGNNPNPFVQTFAYTLENFEARPNPPNASLPTIRGSAKITVQITLARGVDLSPWSLTASATLQPVTVPDSRLFPCLDDACSCGDGPPRFPVTPPFLHEDPLHPGQAADWKVVAFAALYAWFAGEFARNQTGTPSQTETQRLRLLGLLYLILARLFVQLQTADDVERITKAIRCLLEAWCKLLLYPGPKCEEGIHGVVIGCATIQGGRITDVDAWGGRRWVMHYPLLAHWGHQFGIVPLDVMASRVFGLICCLAHLPLPSPGDGLKPGDSTGGFEVNHPSPNFFGGNIPRAGATQPQGTPASGASVGSVHFFTRSGAGLEEDLRSAGIQPAARRELPTQEFIGELLIRMRTDNGAKGPYVLYKMKGASDIYFAAPVPYEPARTDDKPTTAPNRGRLPDYVKTAQPQARAKAPALLRSTADTLAADILTRIPLRRVQAGETADCLAAAGVDSVGAFLASDPEDTFKSLKAVDPSEFTTILERSEAVGSTVAKAVFDATRVVASDQRLFTREDVARPEHLRALRGHVVEAITKYPGLKDLDAEVSSALESTFGVSPGENERARADTPPPPEPPKPGKPSKK